MALVTDPVADPVADPVVEQESGSFDCEAGGWVGKQSKLWGRTRLTVHVLATVAFLIVAGTTVFLMIAPGNLESSVTINSMSIVGTRKDGLDVVADCDVTNPGQIVYRSEPFDMDIWVPGRDSQPLKIGAIRISPFGFDATSIGTAVVNFPKVRATLLTTQGGDSAAAAKHFFSAFTAGMVQKVTMTSSAGATTANVVPAFVKSHSVSRILPLVRAFNILPMELNGAMLRPNAISKPPKTVLMAMPPPKSFKVTLETPGGTKTFDCLDDEYILDRAEAIGIDLPYSCRSGSCGTCAGKVLSGTVDRSDDLFLDDEQIDDGFCMTCVTRPTSDVTIKSHCEEDVF